MKKSEMERIIEEEGVKWFEEMREFIKTLPERTNSLEETITRRIVPMIRKYRELEKKYPRFTRLLDYLGNLLTHLDE